MSNFNTPLIKTLFIYSIINIFLFTIKPNLLFTNDGKIKSFGCGDNKTIISVPFLTITLSIVFYFIMTLYNKFS